MKSLFLFSFFGCTDAISSTEYPAVRNRSTNFRKLIVNGKPVENFIPWQVYGAYNEEKHKCGGTIIGKDMVLTAAHCEKVMAVGNFVWAGIKDRTKLDAAPAQKRKIVEIVSQPTFDIGKLHEGNDVAIVRVEPDFDFSDPTIVSAARLSVKRPADGESVDLSGFGRKTPTEVTEALRESTASIGACGKLSELAKGPIDSKIFCALGNANTVTCSGDSGGPAISRQCGGKPFVVGVVSFGSSKCDTSSPGAFTDVASVSNWIKTEWKRISPGSYLVHSDCGDSGDVDDAGTSDTNSSGIGVAIVFLIGAIGLAVCLAGGAYYYIKRAMASNSDTAKKTGTAVDSTRHSTKRANVAKKSRKKPIAKTPASRR